MTTGNFAKSMLKVGTYHSPDGTVNVTPRRLKHWAKNFKKLNAAQQVVPMHWDHGDDIDSLRPLSKSEYQQDRSAGNTVGRMVGFDLAPDGRSAEVRFRTSCGKATRKVDEGDVYVSPVIMPRWRDGAGNNYSDLITHLDLVNHPVDHSQGPARRIQGTVACALRMGIGSKPLRLAGDYVDPDQKDDIEELDVDMDLGSDDLPDTGGDDVEIVDIDGGDDIDLDAGDDDLSLDDDIMADEPVEDLIEPDTTVGDLMLALADHGIILPEDTSDSNFMDRLRTALIATAASDGGTDPLVDSLDSEDTIVADPQVATMSAFATKQYNAKLKRNIQVLLKTGRCTPAEAKEQLAKSKTMKLSLTRKGNPKANDVTKWIRSRADLPAGAVWSPRERLRRMSGKIAEPKATKLHGDQKLSPEQLNAAVDDFFNQTA